MPKQDENFHTGHRERLKAKFLDNKLTEYEQLELLLSFAIPRRDVRPIARKLIEHFGSVYYVIIAEYEDLIAVPGVGPSSALLIKLVCSLIKISHTKILGDTSVFYNQQSLEEFCRMQIAAKTDEEMHVIYLDGNFRLIEHEVHSLGSIDSSNVYINRILFKALKNSVRSVVLLHNHPTTNNMFSTQDVLITEKIQETLNNCGLELYDHYVVASGILYSMRERGLLNRSMVAK
jgi:DNA repair protein RadC